MLFQDGIGVVRPFALTDGFEARRLRCQIKAADAGEQARNSISHIFSKAITNIPNPAEICPGKYEKEEKQVTGKTFCPCFHYFYGADSLKIAVFFLKGVDIGERWV